MTPIERLVELQIRRPFVPLFAVALVTIVLGIFASRLELHASYDALLPENAPSVIELRRLEKRTSATHAILVLLEHDDRRVLRAMGDALAADLRALGPDTVSSAADGEHDARAFLGPRATLFLDKAELERVDRELAERWDFEVSKADGVLLDENAIAPPMPSVDELRARHTRERFPDGYYERANGTALVVVVHTPVAGADLERAGPVLERVRAAVEHVHAAPQFTGVRVSYAGDVPTAFAEYHVVLHDLLDVGAAGLALVLVVVLGFFVRFRAVLVMGITISVGLIWTFGLTRIFIGHLNIATAFLISIVAGNGINVGILYQSRYFEERRAGASPSDAIRKAVRATWMPTIIAALAAAASYGSLISTDFRAFRDFGLIAAGGMLVCWVVKTLMVPPLLVLLDRQPVAHAPRFAKLDMGYGKPFAWLVPKAPRLFLALGVIVGLAGTAAGVRYVTHGPMDYDMRTLQNDGDAELRRAWHITNEILGASQGAMVVATDTADDANALVEILRARWRDAPANAKPFVAVHTLADFVPSDQEAKIPTALAVGDRLERAHARGFVSEADWAELRELVPPRDLAPFTTADLPAAVREPFTDTQGHAGTLVLVEAAPDTSNDLRDLVRYADSYREARLPSGKIVRGSGTAVIFADMLDAVVRDVPRAVLVSLALTIVVVLLTFRRGVQTLAVLFALWVGIAGIALFLYASNIKINFLNFAALPITFGIGVDYAINIAQRYVASGNRDMAMVLRTSGGAVVLCSLTTLLGYLALLGSHNHAIRSLGAIAAAGELSCLLAAVVVLPALWLAQVVRTPKQHASIAAHEQRKLPRAH